MKLPIEKTVILAAALGVIMLLSVNCSLFEGEPLSPIPIDMAVVVQEMMHNGELANIATELDDPRPQLLRLMNFFVNEEDGQKVFEGHGLGVRPTIEGNQCSAMKGMKVMNSNYDAYSSWMAPDLSVVMPHIYGDHTRIYYEDLVHDTESTYANVMSFLSAESNKTIGTSTVDNYKALGENIIDVEFRLNPTNTYFNVYRIGIDEIEDIRSDLANDETNFLYQDNFDYIEIALLRDHFPGRDEDGIAFIENQYTISMFFGLVKDGEYVKIESADSYSIIVRLVDLTTGGKFVSTIYASEDQTGDTVTVQLNDFLNYLKNTFEPIEPYND